MEYKIGVILACTYEYFKETGKVLLGSTLTWLVR